MTRGADRPTDRPGGRQRDRDTPPLPPLVAVPGLGLSHTVPRAFLDGLPTASSAVVELPGYGLPAARDTALDPVALARLLLGRLDDLGITRAVLLGHSASCQIVAQVAASAPRRVAALVLAGPTTDPRAAGWPALAVRWSATALAERPWQVPLLVRDYHRSGLGAMARAMDAARHHRIDRVLATVRCPVLVVRGRHDRIAPPDWTRALAAATPCGRAETLLGGAHMVPLTHPAALAVRVRTFLQRCLRCTGTPDALPAPPGGGPGPSGTGAQAPGPANLDPCSTGRC